MKFLCDRCKTRYSIGDERVRGKILKIRCKNCNNVITVREGMAEIGADDARRIKQPTQAVEATGGNGALGAAFASAMTKPPPALEEEWYVSIDGEQAGPFNLAEAQRWVAGKPVDAELHCWSEGFDDWLPVDKVSHFRGLRKRPASPTAPPPIPRAATAAHRAVTRPEREDEPKPLFAATMASLEKATQPPLGSGNFQIPAITPQPAAPTRTPSPLAARGPEPRALGQPAARANGSAPLPSVTPARVAAAAATRPIFDPADSATQIEAPPFADEGRTAAEPVAGARREQLPKADPFAPTTLQQAKADPFAAVKPPLDLTQPIMPEDIDGDLDIGEVSRVVKLADLAKTAPPRGDRAPVVERASRASQPPMNRIGSGAAIPLLKGTGSAASIPLPTIGPDGRQIDPTTGEPIPLAPQVAVSHRRGMIALLVGALVLLGAAGAVVFMVTSNDDGGTTGLKNVSDIDTTRPDDPRRRGSGNAETPQVADNDKPQNPFVPRPRPRQNPNTNPVPTNPDAKALRADEIEEMAARYSGTTNRCYLRSQRGAESIIIGDLKKLGVTLTVDKEGVVTNVQLSEHASTGLGKCLIASIKLWKFRQSSNGITARITMVFQGA